MFCGLSLERLSISFPCSLLVSSCRISGISTYPSQIRTIYQFLRIQLRAPLLSSSRFRLLPLSLLFVFQFYRFRHIFLNNRHMSQYFFLAGKNAFHTCGIGALAGYLFLHLPCFLLHTQVNKIFVRARSVSCTQLRNIGIFLQPIWADRPFRSNGYLGLHFEEQYFGILPFVTGFIQILPHFLQVQTIFNCSIYHRFGFALMFKNVHTRKQNPRMLAIAVY